MWLPNSDNTGAHDDVPAEIKSVTPAIIDGELHALLEFHTFRNRYRNEPGLLGTFYEVVPAVANEDDPRSRGLYSVIFGAISTDYETNLFDTDRLVGIPLVIDIAPGPGQLGRVRAIRKYEEPRR